MASIIRKLSLLKNGLLKCGGGGGGRRTIACGRFCNFQFGSGFCSQVPVVGMTNDTSKQIGNLISSNELAKNESEGQSELDVLYKRMELEVRGHDAAVLKSYEWFATTAAKHLGITVSRTWIPPVHKVRRRALKSAFAHGKHIVQYEFRTYFRIMELVRLTGSTADTYLEYIQRNLPEGVAMKVTRERIEKLPPHIKPFSK